jgi:hypothetical protein
VQDVAVLFELFSLENPSDEQFKKVSLRSFSK